MTTIETRWPHINSNAWLRLPCCNAEHPTRVEDFVGDDDCVVAVPTAPHEKPVDPASLKNGFFLGWANGRGATEAPVELVAEMHDRVPTWRLRCVGRPVETQRRRYVRIQYSGEAKLYLIESGAPAAAIIDTLSEGGLGCKVDRWAIDPRARIFVVDLFLGEQHFSLKAQIAWWGNLDDNEQRTIGIEFVNTPQRTSDELRAFVFGEQLRQRKNQQ